jgi:glycosyltransferase involved in cell wall biosynthesis
VARLVVVEDLAAPAVVGRGGSAMYVLQFLEGLRRLGHHVLFVEFLSDPPEPGAVRYFEEVLREWWSLERSALILEPARESLAGVGVAAVSEAGREADALITIAAHYRREPWPLLEAIRPRILFEQDPGYTHLWAAEQDPVDVFGEHDAYFTVGANVGTPRCALPTLGIEWRALFHPVVLEWWSAERPVVRDRFTTVASWRDYGYLEWDGRVLGPKCEEFRRFLGLPGLAGEAVELALEIDPEDPDRAELERQGWRLEDPEIVATPGRYMDYVSGSLGELSCAKGGYVGTRSGWFSDRSECYLAAGRPCVLQTTGFEDVLPTGEGLFAVGTAAEAAEAMQEVRGDYARHSAAAREIAREHFDSDLVLTRMLAGAGI